MIKYASVSTCVSQYGPPEAVGISCQACQSTRKRSPKAEKHSAFECNKNGRKKNSNLYDLLTHVIWLSPYMWQRLLAAEGSETFFSFFCLFPRIVLKASATSEQPAPPHSVCLKYNERAKSSTKENLSKEEHDWMRRRMPSWERTYFLNIAGWACCFSEWLVRWDWHSYPPTSTRKSFLERMNLRCSASNHPFRACQCSIDGK